MRNDTAVPVVEIAAATATPLQQVMDLLREHGPVIRRRLHGHETLFVADPDLVAELCDEERFAKHVGPALENVREFAGDGLFTAYNEEPAWAAAHGVLMPAFALGSMRTYHPVMLRVARRLIRSWDAAGSAPVDVPEDMTRMTLDTIGLAGFGYDFGSFGRAEPHPFVQAMVRCLEWSMNRLGRLPGGDYGAEDAAFAEDAAHLAAVVDEVIAARTESGETGQDDLMGLMLDSGLEHTTIRNQVITFLIAGHETTSGALSFALHHLVRHPGELRAVQREVDALWGATADPEPSFEDVGLLRRTRQVLNEALRLWPTAAAFSRHARVDTLLGGRIPMRAGDAATVVVPMLHRDAGLWGDNPDLFDPSRFAPEAEAARPAHAYKPFGTGERACIGRQFALHEATMLLALLVHRYRFVDHAGYRLRVKEALTLKPDGFTLTVLPRTERFAAPRTGPAVPAERRAQGPARVLPGTEVLVLHGSNYGTCRGFAQDLAAAAEGAGCAAEVAPLDAYTGGLPAGRPVVVVAASYNGRPTDDAAGFAEWLEKAGAEAVRDVPYAVLGVGDRNWAATYQRVPARLDERLAELGGDRLVARGEADASGDLGGAVRAFTDGLLRALLERYGDPASADEAGGPDGAAGVVPAYTVTELSGGPLDAVAERHGLTPMTVTESWSLTEPGYARVKRFVRVALPEGVTYRTADHLAVLPANPPALVDRTARLLGADPDTVLSIVPARPGRAALAVDRPVTVRELLTHLVDLGHRPGAAALARLAELVPCPPEAAALRATPPGTATLPELAETYPALGGALTWPVLLEVLEPMRPRTYSVSSSPAVDPRHADLMVSAAAPGTGSAYLAALRPGDTVLAGVRPCREAFRVVHGDEPLIMVAAGTGLAPFRGVVADRRALLDGGARELGPALLYFGCDAPDADYLHARELRAAEAGGAVSLRPAFSEAPVDGARFVQHRIAADAAELWPLLRRGARVYVCGDATRMAPGVRDAFRALYAQHAPDAGDEAARVWLDRLVADGRYVEDVYGG
ncbi:cytochrome P450 [Streptomyces sp. NPDC015131]|uniref:cytochrome P450 n=1 Tax=Streptomyces sp. NPDC015131 TaxID=3364941 RepID=UPI0036FF059C